MTKKQTIAQMAPEEVQNVKEAYIADLNETEFVSLRSCPYCTADEADLVIRGIQSNCPRHGRVSMIVECLACKRSYQEIYAITDLKLLPE